MPDKLVKQLQKRLLPFEVHARDQTKDYLENPENRYIFEMMIQADSDNVNFDSYEIRDAFFEFNLTLMKNYPKYWVRCCNKTEKSEEGSHLSGDHHAGNRYYCTLC